MSKEPNYKSYVRQLGEKTRDVSAFRMLPDIAGCTTYGFLCHAPHNNPNSRRSL